MVVFTGSHSIAWHALGPSVMLCYVTLCYIMLYYVSYDMICHVMLYYVVFYYAMIRYVMLFISYAIICQGLDILPDSQEDALISMRLLHNKQGRTSA